MEKRYAVRRYADWGMTHFGLFHGTLKCIVLTGMTVVMPGTFGLYGPFTLISDLGLSATLRNHWWIFAFSILSLWLILYIFPGYLIGYFQDSVDITLAGRSIIGRTLFFRETRISYRDVDKVVAKKAKFKELHIVAKDGKTMISLGMVQDLGEIVETLLERCPNVTEVDFLDYLENTFENKPDGVHLWGKVPDWKIIKQAKARAEENRKKMENTIT